MDKKYSEYFDSLLNKAGKSSELKEDKDNELRKAVLTHLLDGDYARIAEIRENYPVQEFMNLLGKFETIVPIDLDRLFKTKR